MRRSVRIKNKIAQAMMILGMFLVLGAGCSMEVTSNMLRMFMVGVKGAILTLSGYKLYRF